MTLCESELYLLCVYYVRFNVVIMRMICSNSLHPCELYGISEMRFNFDNGAGIGSRNLFSPPARNSGSHIFTAGPYYGLVVITYFHRRLGLEPGVKMNL